MKTSEIIQRVQSMYSRGVQSDDTRLSNRHIYSKLVTVRARLLTQEAKKKQRISQWNYQPLPCVEVIKVPKHECPCYPPTDCMVLRTRHKIPKPLLNYSDNLIQFVGTLDMSIKFNSTTNNAVNSLKGNKYGTKGHYYFVLNDYIYLVTPLKLDGIMIVGLFEDPIKANEFPSMCGDSTECEECIDILDSEFPIDNDKVEPLIELAMQELVIMFTRMQEDINNNNNEDE